MQWSFSFIKWYILGKIVSGGASWWRNVNAPLVGYHPSRSCIQPMMHPQIIHNSI